MVANINNQLLLSKKRKKLRLLWHQNSIFFQPVQFVSDSKPQSFSLQSSNFYDINMCLKYLVCLLQQQCKCKKTTGPQTSRAADRASSLDWFPPNTNIINSRMDQVGLPHSSVPPRSYHVARKSYLLPAHKMALAMTTSPSPMHDPACTAPCAILFYLNLPHVPPGRATVSTPTSIFNV